MKMLLKQCLLVWVSLFAFSTVNAAVIDSYKFDDTGQQEQFFRLNNELRCPQCQNQSIADSNAPIAQDLRREVHRMIVDEKADDETIVQFMLDRYGDFVLYKPRMTSTTAALWIGPFVLLFFGLFMLFRILRKHRPESSQPALDEQEQTELNKILGGKDQ